MSNNVCNGASVTFVRWPVVRKTFGLSPGLIQSAGSVCVDRKVGISIASMGGLAGSQDQDLSIDGTVTPVFLWPHHGNLPFTEQRWTGSAPSPIMDAGRA